MSFILETHTIINIPSSANNPVIEELLSNYTYGKKWSINYTESDCSITIGNYSKVDISDSEYVLNITDAGIYIGAINYSAMMHGFFTFLENIKYSSDNDYFYLDNTCIYDKPILNFRCVHLCVFPETKLDFLKKSVRACAIAKYSHIILEFWGMLKLDCMKELSWPFAYSKEDIKNIVDEANSLGVEIIPMFNHMGHASMCREANGKHVILDQNPQYEYMFESYGWIWNIKREDVRILHKKIRDELIEVCGNGSYFHIGCDETYSYGHDEINAHEMVKYINSVCEELKAKGRRAIMWHDMLLSRDDFKGYVTNSSKKVSDLLLKHLDKNLIIADWQYSACDEPWETSKALKESNFDVLCCPWESLKNIDQAINTVTSNNLFGIIHTTWHTLYKGFAYMIYAGTASYGSNHENFFNVGWPYSASIIRKVMPSNGDYEKSGWSEKMTGPGL